MNDTPTIKRDPTFGYDPWIGPGTPPGEAGWRPEAHGPWVADPANHVHIVGAELAETAQAFAWGEDAFDVDQLNDGLSFYAAYVDNYGGYYSPAQGNRQSLRQRFANLPEWHGPPMGYTSASNMGALIAAAGGRQFVRISAHYGYGPHVCSPSTCGYPQADRSQWLDHGPQGQNVDQLVALSLEGNPRHTYSYTIFGNRAHCADVEPGGMSVGSFNYWYDNVAIHGQAPPPQPPTPKEIMSIASAKNASGDLNVVVAGSDNTLWYTFQTKGQLAWNGGQGGQRIAGLAPFAPAPPKPIVDMTMDTNAEGDLQLLVELSDGSVYYTFQAHGQHGWNGGADGKHIAALTPLAPPPGH